MGGGGGGGGEQKGGREEKREEHAATQKVEFIFQQRRGSFQRNKTKQRAEEAEGGGRLQQLKCACGLLEIHQFDGWRESAELKRKH